MKITAVTPACKNISVNEVGNSVFHPIIKNNAKFAGLSWVRTHYSNGHALDDRNFDSTLRFAITGGVGWGDAYIRPVTNRSKVAITSYTPPIGEINEKTPNVVIAGKIANPFDDKGGLDCVVTFLGSYIRDARQAQ